MQQNNFQKELSKYYSRRGSLILFKNRYTLNELSMEMWDKLNYRGMDPSTLSRVINGKRLFTLQQLEIFCSVLKINSYGQQTLTNLLKIEYLMRYGIRSHHDSIQKRDKLINYSFFNFARESGLILLIGFYIILFFWWLFLFIYDVKDGPLNLGYSAIYALIPLSGFLLGIFKVTSIKNNNALRRGLLLFSLGLLSWFIGELFWAYYNFFFDIEIPYPSLADLGYFISWPLWLAGAIYLSKATGNLFRINSTLKIVILVSLPIIALILSYYFLIARARSSFIITNNNFLKLFLDFYYPIFDSLIITYIILTWSDIFRSPGKEYKWSVLLVLSGFILNFIGNLSLNYTSTIGTYYNGSPIDFILTTAMLLISFGINSLPTSSHS